MPTNQHTTIIAVVGRPNAGKSTLVNALVGKKIAITSRRPQTTRHRIHAIYTDDNYQFVFIDTPGINKAAQGALLQELNKTTRSALSDADLTLFMLDGLLWEQTEETIARYLPEKESKCIAILNKLDRYRQRSDKVAGFLRLLAEKKYFSEIVPLSCRKSTDINYLKKILKRYAVEREFMFSAEQSTDQNMRFYASELIREKILRRFNREVPYTAAVMINHYKEEGIKLYIKATVHVERAAHKQIIVGKNGLGIREVGKQVRQLLEKKTGRHVDIRLWVKVSRSWSTNPQLLREFGYQLS